MPQVVFPTSAAVFGIEGGSNTLLNSQSISTKMDKKDGRDMDGNIVAYAMYGQMAEHSLEILGVANADVAVEALGSMPAYAGSGGAAIAGTAFVVDEVSVEYSNEDFVKTNISISEYFIED